VKAIAYDVTPDSFLLKSSWISISS
jgi:hypothetical protein